jgi:hypothetical protein
MIRYLIQWRACRRLNKLVAKQRASYETRRYRERRTAALKATRTESHA